MAHTLRGSIRRLQLALRVCTYLLLACFCVSSLAQVNVYTRSYDNARSGANLQETILTPANVNSNSFGKLFTVHTDGQIYAQPLYVSNLTIAGATHNVVFAASMLNTVYAIDADSGTVLWSQNFGTPIVPQNVESDQNIVWTTGLGILGTPVIDPATNYMYFVSGEQPTGTYNYSFNLNAIDITTGLPVHGSPVTIAATYTTADLTSPLVFNAKVENPRPGLALANGNVYLAFASHEDQNSYKGWVLAYSTSTLAQTGVYSDTTTGSQGGIWNAGQSPTIDATGNIYISTGNGSFGTTPNNLVQTGNSMIKLSPTLELLDYFTPYNSATLNSGDMDLGSSGLLLIPNTTYLLGGGKQGVLYLVDTTNMGKFNTSTDQVRQEFQAVYGKGTSHIHGGAIYFNSDANGPSTYVWGENDVLRGFQFNATTGMVNTTPFAKSTMTAPATNNDGAMPGGFVSLSANNDENGILWASTPYAGDALHQSTQGVLYAFNASTLNLLWTDKTNDTRDEVGMFAKYVPPIVANGKMYITNFGAVGTNDGTGNLICYGLLRQLTVAVANATMPVGGPLPTLTGTVTGLVNGDTLGTTVVVTYSTTATTTSPAGTYPITATVTGSSAANYNVVVNAGTLTVSPSTQVLTVSASNATRAYGAANPAFTGTVTGAQSGDTFTESFTTTATTTSPVGSYPIVPAATGADLGNYTVTIVDGNLTVTQATQTITFPAIASRAYGSAPFAVTASSSAGTGYPVTITVQSGPATIAAGTVTVTGPGTVVLVASQAGDANYSAATATQSFAVTSAQLTVTANNATRVFNTANPTFSGTVTGALGSDTFSETFTTTATTTSNVGSYPIVPAVTGTHLANYSVSVVNGALTVTAAPTSTTLVTPATATAGASVALSATVSSTAGTPAGVVTFYSGSTALGTGTLNGSGVAILSISTLASGTDSLTASYPATGNFAASTSATGSIAVSGSTQTINFPAIANQVYGSAPFAVTATSSLGSSYPVTISVQSGPATISGGMVTVTAVGPVVLLASQAGDGQHSAATATQSFQVTPAATTTALSAPTTATSGASVTISATVTSTAGTPGGTVTFSSGSTSLGAGTLASGVASLSTTALPTGTDTITATYTAAGNFAASSGSASVTVSAASSVQAGTFSLATSPASLTVHAGQTGSATVTLTPTGGYTGTVTFSCTNLPSGASCSFAQSPITLKGDNQSVAVGMTVSTATQQASNRAPRSPAAPGLLALAFWWPGGLTGLAVFARKRNSKMSRAVQLCLLLLCVAACAAGLSGCGMSSTIGATVSQVTVVASGTSGAAISNQSVGLILTVNP